MGEFLGCAGHQGQVSRASLTSFGWKNTTLPSLQLGENNHGAAAAVSPIPSRGSASDTEKPGNKKLLGQV